MIDFENINVQTAELFWTIVILAGLVTASYFLMPKPPKPAIPQPDDKLDIPTTEEGRSCGVVFGTVWVKDPVVGWWGDLRTQAIKESSGGK